MLSGEGNENRETTIIGLISKKNNFAHVWHTFFCTFLCRCFARLQRETSRNFLVTLFMEEMSYMFLFTFHCRLSFKLSDRVRATMQHLLWEGWYYCF